MGGVGGAGGRSCAGFRCLISTMRICFATAEYPSSKQLDGVRSIFRQLLIELLHADMIHLLVS